MIHIALHITLRNIYILSMYLPHDKIFFFLFFTSRCTITEELSLP